MCIGQPIFSDCIVNNQSVMFIFMHMTRCWYTFLYAYFEIYFPVIKSRFSSNIIYPDCSFSSLCIYPFFSTCPSLLIYLFSVSVKKKKKQSYKG